MLSSSAAAAAARGSGAAADAPAAIAAGDNESWRALLLSETALRGGAAMLDLLHREPTLLPEVVRGVLHLVREENHAAAWLDVLLLGTRPAETSARLTALLGSQSGGVCAAQFRPGEPAYQCAFCGNDPTCIQCVRCYKQADHSGHEDQVRMVSAGGGGCCDCGDTSSWKEAGTCSRHKPSSSSLQGELDVSGLFSEAQLNLQRSFAAELMQLLALAVGCCERDRDTQHWPVLLLQDRCLELPVVPAATDMGMVFLLNDDVHSFDQVIEQLRLAVGTDQAQGTLLANAVHGCERALAFVGSELRCRAVAAKLSEIGLGVEQHPLQPYTLLVRESRMTTVITWMNKFSQQAHFFRDMFSAAVMQPIRLPEAYTEARRAAAAAAAAAPTAVSAAADASRASPARQRSDSVHSAESSDGEFDIAAMRRLAAAELGGDEQPEPFEESQADPSDEVEGADEHSEDAKEDDDDEEEDGEDDAESVEGDDDRRVYELDAILDENGALHFEAAREVDDEGEGGEAAGVPVLELAGVPAAAAAAGAAAAGAGADAAALLAQGELELGRGDLQALMQILTGAGGNGGLPDLAGAPPAMREALMGIIERGMRAAAGGELPAGRGLRAAAAAAPASPMEDEDERSLIGVGEDSQGEEEDLGEDGVSLASPPRTPLLSARSRSNSAAAASAVFAGARRRVDPLCLDALLLNSSYLSAGLFSALSALTFTFFTHPSWKLQYARRFVLHLEALVATYNKFSGALEHSALDYAVQLFTIPSIALALAQEEQVFAVITAMLQSYLLKHRPVAAAMAPGSTCIQCTSLSRSDNPFGLVLSDLGYVLRVPAVPQWLWSHQPAELLRSWFACLELQEGMDPQTLKRHVHAEYQSTAWQHAFTLAIRTNNVSQQLLNSLAALLAKPDAQTQTVLRIVLAECEGALRRLWRSEKLRVRAHTHSTCADASVGGLPLLPFAMRVLSFHHPLSRFIAELVLLVHGKADVRIGADDKSSAGAAAAAASSSSLPRVVWAPKVALRVAKSEQQSAAGSKYVVTSVPLGLHLLDVAARSIAWLGQISAGLWVLNGDALQNQAYNATRKEVNALFSRADWTALQSSVLYTREMTTGAFTVVNVLMRRFQLQHYLHAASSTPAAERARSLRRVQEWSDAGKLGAVMDAFLSSVLVVITDRERVGKLSRHDRAQQQLVQRLLLGPCTYSQVAKLLSTAVDDEDEDEEVESSPAWSAAEIKQLLAEVADYRTVTTRTAADTAGVYEIKASMLCRFSPYVAAWTAEQRQMGESNYHRLLDSYSSLHRGAKPAGTELYPPRDSFAPFLRPEFGELTRALLHPAMIDMLFHVVRRYVRGEGETAAAPGQKPKITNYMPPPAAGNQRGMHERVVTHAVYLLALGVQECLVQLQRAAEEAQTDSTSSRQRQQHVRDYMRALVKMHPAADKQPSASLLVLICQLNVTALQPVHDAAAAATAGSSASTGRSFSDWTFTLQQPRMAHTLAQLQQLDAQLMLLEPQQSASVVSNQVDLYAAAGEQLRSTMLAYAPPASASATSAAGSHSDGSLASMSREDRAARLARGLKIRRRIVKGMQRRLEAFAAANPGLGFELPLKKSKTKKEQKNNAAEKEEAKTEAAKAEETAHECIMCRAPASGASSGLITFMQQSTVHLLPVQTPPSDPFELRERVLTDPAADGSRRVMALSHRALPLQVPERDFAGNARDTQLPIIARSCGHVLHTACLDSYLATLMQRQQSGRDWEGMQTVDLAANQFVCPLCRQLANCLVPLPPQSAAAAASATSAAAAASPASAVPSEVVPFQLSRALQFTAPTTDWHATSTRLRQWTLEQATTAPATPAAPAIPAPLSSQQGLLISFAEQAAKLSGRSLGAGARFDRDMMHVCFLLGCIVSTARGVEIGARHSVHAYGTLVQAGKSVFLEDQLQQHDLAVLACLMDGLTTLLHTPAAQWSSDPHELLRHVRSSHTALMRLFAGESAAGAASPAPLPAPALDSMVDSNADASFLLGALQAINDMESSVRSSSPAAVSRLQSLMSRLRSAPQQAMSILRRNKPARHEDDLEALPLLNARDLLLEDPFELLVRCVVSSGQAVGVNRESLSAELHDVLVLLWALCVFQAALHLAFGREHDNQHAWAADFRQELNHAWQGRAARAHMDTAAHNQMQDAQPAAAASSAAHVGDAPLEQFNPLLAALRRTRFGTDESSAAAAASDAYPMCCRPTEAVLASFLLPFLRCALVLFRACHAVPAPAHASTRRGSKAAAAESPLLAEFHSLVQTLHLPSLDELLSSPQGAASMDTAASGPSTSSVPLLFQPLVAAFGALYPAGIRPTLPLQSAFVPASFIRLPQHYDALFQALSEPVVCTTCGTAPAKPALCLQTGRLLCAQSDCCRVNQHGELTRHTQRCCPCAGVFLLLREAGVLSLSLGLSHPAGSCYTDRENETDVGLRRGRPLHLQADRLEALRQMVMQPGALTSYISRGRGHRYMHELQQRNTN